MNEWIFICHGQQRKKKNQWVETVVQDSKAEYSTKYCPNKNELNKIRYARQMQ